MALVRDIFGRVFRNGVPTLMARVVGHLGRYVKLSDITGVTYSVELLDTNDPMIRESVTGQTDVSVAPSEILYETLQRDSRWTCDNIGFNFRHILNPETSPFTQVNSYYLVTYRLTSASMPPILVRFRLMVI